MERGREAGVEEGTGEEVEMSQDRPAQLDLGQW